jgi:hypothetical protein
MVRRYHLDQPSDLTYVNGLLFFITNDGFHGQELHGFFHPENYDGDRDGLTDPEEARGWWDPVTEQRYDSDRFDPDTDDDGILDGEEKLYHLDPRGKVPAFTKSGERGSWDQCVECADPKLRSSKPSYFREQHLEMDAVKYHDPPDAVMGIALEGQLWGPRSYYSLPGESSRWGDWGGVELEIYCKDLDYVNTGSRNFAPANFHILVEPIEPHRWCYANRDVDANVNLDVTWEFIFISEPRDLSFGEATKVASMWHDVGETLGMGLGMGGPGGTSWGFSADGDGNWGIKFGGFPWM